jgi:hypothetical protein
VIGHLKSDGLLERNHLAGKHGDAINLILAAAGHNLRLILAWLRHLLCPDLDRADRSTHRGRRCIAARSCKSGFFTDD